MNYLIFIAIFLANLLLVGLYIRIAGRRVMLDTPCERSSHQIPTVIGGGIFIVLTFIISATAQRTALGFSFLALFPLTMLSLLDDYRPLPARVRLVMQFVCVALLILTTSPTTSLISLGIGLILITGWLNTFNFMDGINGITATYATTCLLSLTFLCTSETSTTIQATASPSLEFSVLAALLAFGFFNFRKQAMCFAGDAGSIGIAMIIAYFFLHKWHGLQSVYMLAFVAVYAVDSVITILIRLRKKENIFAPHRNHLYQRLANEAGWDHRVVSFSYSAVQGIISLIAFWFISTQPANLQIQSLGLLYLLLSVFFLFARSKTPSEKIAI